MRLLTAVFCTIAVLTIAAAPAAAETTYDAALATAIAKDDAAPCGAIDQSRAIQDYVVRPEDLQEQCRIAFTVAKKDPAGCLALSNTPAPGSISSRHQCLEALANITRNPGLCEKIELPVTADNAIYRDRCRAGAITDITQCTQGFHTASWGKAFKDAARCVDQVAVNTRNPGLCQIHGPGNDKLQCEKAAGTEKPDSGHVYSPSP
jgi:hypothetical protein